MNESDLRRKKNKAEKEGGDRGNEMVLREYSLRDKIKDKKT